MHVVSVHAHVLDPFLPAPVPFLPEHSPSSGQGSGESLEGACVHGRVHDVLGAYTGGGEAGSGRAGGGGGEHEGGGRGRAGQDGSKSTHR